jgi:hypothetical protein
LDISSGAKQDAEKLEGCVSKSCFVSGHNFTDPATNMAPPKKPVATGNDPLRDAQ